MAMTELFFVGAKRTPFGANGGSLKDVHPTDLVLSCARAAIEQAGVAPQQIDHVIVGNVLYATSDTIYIPRHVGLRLGVPEERPALGINRLCGSGFQVIIEAFQQMCVGDTEIALVAGVENMSQTPYAMQKTRWGARMGNFSVYDMLSESLMDTYAGAPMAITAERLAEQYRIARDEIDAFALRSQCLAAEAQKNGRFTEEIVPFEIVDKKGSTKALAHDEHMRPETTQESLSKLKPIFKKDGVVTAGNASGIVDGAAALVVASEQTIKKHRLNPLGRMVSYAVVGCDPRIMGIGPVPAIRQLLKKTGRKLADVDLIEINEAFAPQTLAVLKELSLDPERVNVNGGAIAIGHPLAASGTRIVAHLLYELNRRNKKWGIGSACIGGGQGIAILVEAF